MKTIMISAAALTLAFPALASGEQAKLEVEVTAKQLATPASAEAFLSALQAKAMRACADNGTQLTLQMRRAQRECAANLVAKAVKSVDAPHLTSAFEGDADWSQLAERGTRGA